MYCVKCGAQLPPDSQFCTSCGARIEDAPTPDVQPNVAPIAPAAAPYGYSQPPKKKSKALLWTLIGAGAALIVAAVLIFVVFAPGGGGPFSGNTVQTRFANDVVGVFKGAFDGLGSDTVLNQLDEKPFDMNLTFNAEVSDVLTNVTLDAAYDEKALGVKVVAASDYSQTDYAEYYSDAEESTTTLLLLEDILYADFYGYTSGVRFETDADLDKAMTLKDRLLALTSSDDEAGKQIDTLKLAEMFLNSIDAECFDKNAKESTLTLDADALTDALKTFADKVDDDDELNDALSALFEEMTGNEYDFASMVSMAAPMLKQEDFEITITVSYDGNRPSGLDIQIEENGGQVGGIVFSYENEKNGKSLSLDIESQHGEIASVKLDLTKTANGLDFDGTISVPGSDKVRISGSQEVKGSDISGTINMSMGSQKVTVAYEGTVHIGLPDSVEDDERFEVDMKNASISDFKDSFGSGFSLPSLLY